MITGTKKLQFPKMMIIKDKKGREYGKDNGRNM